MAVHGVVYHADSALHARRRPRLGDVLRRADPSGFHPRGALSPVRLRHPDGETLHLAYCSNAHPADELEGVLGQLERYALPVRERLGVNRLGVGLWLSHVALDAERSAARLRAELERLGLEVVTLNGVPYRSFHAPVVKSRVYTPSWADPRRRHYTIGLAWLLAQVMPDDVTEGSISSLPLGWRHEWSPICEEASRAALGLVADGLRTIEAQTGKRIRIALEPEPGCAIETVAQAAGYLAGLDPERIGVCLDACHLAVQFERPDESLATLADAGVPIAKAQVSSALEVEDPASPAGRELLGAYSEPRFLHQVRERVDGHLAGSDDLPDALAGELPGEREWRVNFHVPVHTAGHSTQRELERTLAALVGGSAPATRHFEVETHTWSALSSDGDGGETEDERLVEGIAGELEWTRERLLALGATRA